MTQGPQSRTSQQLKNEREVRKYQDELGNSEAVARLIDRYGKVSTRRVYLVSLVLYFRWLKSLGVVMSPDELVTDNLTCVFHGPGRREDEEEAHGLAQQIRQPMDG